MAERSMAVVLKTTKVQAFGGSNPSPSATFGIQVVDSGYQFMWT